MKGTTMDIYEFAIGQTKELASLFAAQQRQEPTRQPHPFVGQFVIARCYAAGVHAGEVVSVDGENVILADSYRLWSWKARDGIALSGVAQNGVDRAKTEIDSRNPIIYLTGVCELIPCSDIAKESICE